MHTFKSNFIKTIPVLTGYLCLGTGFGIMLASHGYGIGWALAMAVSIFSGSMQYVGVELLATQASLVIVAVTTFMVNCRYLFYGFTMLDKYKGMGIIKPYLIFGLTDETYLILCNDETFEKKDYIQVTLMDHSYWILGCLIGSLLGSLIPWDFKGIDFVLTALFVSILVEQWMSTKRHHPTLIGIITTVACLLIFGSENFLIPSMIAIIVFLVIYKHFDKETKIENKDIVQDSNNIENKNGENNA